MSKKPVWAVAFALDRVGVPCPDLVAWKLRNHVHSYIATVTPPTCTEAGYTTYRCSCGHSYNADEVTALGHTNGDAVVENEVAATCTESGSYEKVTYCTACGEEITRTTVTVGALGHDKGQPVVENRVEATPVAEGSYDTVVYCKRCGMELSRTITTIPQLTLKGYSYNGVLLPDLGSRVTGANPYAVWTMDGGGSCTLWLTPEPVCCYVTANSSGAEMHRLCNTTGKTMKYWKWWGLQDGSTSFKSLYSLEYTADAGSSLSLLSYSVSPPLIFWANYDVYQAASVEGSGYVATDTLFFPRSPDPVPVYE